MMTIGKSALALLASTLLWLAPVAQAAEAMLHFAPGGQITEVRLAENVVVIDGLSYRVSLDARIEVNGSFGAFTMLERGMKVEYVYNSYGEARREIIGLRHLPDEAEVPRH